MDERTYVPVRFLAENLLTPVGKFGYGVQLVNGRGYATYAKGQ